jgi:hypothetical protein
VAGSWSRYVGFRRLALLHLVLTIPVRQNQWGEVTVLPVEEKLYGNPLSTVFGQSDEVGPYDGEDDYDPLMPELRILNYRYVRLFYHPVKDLFILFSGWKDPAWSDVKAARLGVTTEEKSVREVVFGSNLIDIEQKSIPKLLIDEVRCASLVSTPCAILTVVRPCIPSTYSRSRA